MSVGSLANFAPADNSSVPSSGFNAFVDLAGFSSSAAAVAQTAAVNLSLAPYPSGKTVFAHDMTLNGSSQPPSASIIVPAITPTRYIARWTLTDINGDSNQYQTLLLAQPSKTVTPPSQTGNSQTGNSHPGEPAGQQSTQGKVCWTVRVKEPRRSRVRTCRELTVPAGATSIAVALRRGDRITAHGTRGWQGSTLSLKLHSRQRLSRRRYLVTITARVGSTTVTLLSRRLRLGSRRMH